MNERKFTNDYDIIVYAFSLLIRRFQREDNIFAAQCIWWLASIIQYTEILRFYFEYQVFPSTYVRDCIVSPLPEKISEESIIPDSDIPELQLDSDTEYRFKSVSRDIAEARSILPVNRTSPSGRIAKPVNLSNKQLRKRYPGRDKKQLQALRTSLRIDGLIN